MGNPLKWHGGKTYLESKLIALMPTHTRYVEPYFGGGAVLFAKDPEGVAEFVNDVNWNLTNFWRVLQEPLLFERFARWVNLTPLSEIEHANSRQGIVTGDPDVMHAVRFFIRYRQSRQGLGRDYCTPAGRLRRGMNENVSAWLSAVDGLPEAHQRLRRVEIWNRDALEVIEKLDSPETLFYCDPPYLHETRSSTGEYEHEMAGDDHRNLVHKLGEIKGKFMLSGYECGMYESARCVYGWHRTDFTIDNKASGKKTKEQKTECVWTNFVPETKARGR